MLTKEASAVLAHRRHGVKKVSHMNSKEANGSENFLYSQAEKEAKEHSFKPKIFTKREKPKSPRAKSAAAGRAAFIDALHQNNDGDENDENGGMNPLAMTRSDSLDSVASTVSNKSVTSSA